MPEQPALVGYTYWFVPARGVTPRQPVLLLLHGTGGDEHDLLPLGEALLPGAAQLSPRGTVVEDGAYRFFRRLAPGVFDVEDLMLRTHALADFVDAAADAHEFVGRPVVAVGYSNGANIAASLLLLRPSVLAGAVLFRAMLPLEPKRVPDLRGMPVFLAAARFDEMMPIEAVERLAALLRAGGAALTVHWQPASHALTAQDMHEAATWVGRQWREERDQA
ncbi:MAG: alpha/beta hydrolase [Sphaerobacter sp.]|nr:alpha/beta hydrolase [Sphaerobacter sp.]